MGAGGAIRRATKLACAIGAVGGIFGVPAAATADVTHPFRPQNQSSFLAAKRGAQARVGLGSPLAPLMAAPGAGPRAVVEPTLNQPGLAAGDNSPNSGTPPDPTGAVGPSHYVEFVNSVVRVYSKADLTTIAGTAQLATFVGAASGHDVFDPQIQYDPVDDRWFYLADECSDQFCSAGNFLAYGWSKTNDPSNLATGWCTFRVQTDTGAAGPTGYFDDYPKLGHNDSHLVFGTNVFDDIGFVSARIWTVPKPPLGPITNCATGTGTPHWFSGSAASPTKDGNIQTNPLRTSDNNIAFTPVPANTQDPSLNAYIVATDAPPGNQIMAWHISGAAGSEALTADGNIGVSPFSTPANVPQPGSSEVLDSSDTRLTQAVAHSDPDAGTGPNAEAVWTQHTINGPGGRSVVRWYELLPAIDTRRQEGNISNASNFVFNGAISPTMAGQEAVIQYNVGGSGQLAQIGASSRTTTSALGTMTGEVLLGTSAAADQDFSCSLDPNFPACRWGDYAGASPDPDLLDPASKHLVWGTNQLIGTPVVDDPRWTTQNFALQATATPLASFTVSPNPEFTGRVVNFDGSGSSGTVDQYDWDFNGDGTYDLVDGGANPSHTYSQAGTFNVRLRVDEAGSTDTTTRSLTIKSGAPTAAFTAAPTVVIRGQSVSFDGSASADAEASGGIESYRWDFDGDGVTDQTTTGPVVTHAYTALGAFNARLAVTDADEHQLSATAARQVTVQNVVPTAQIAFSPAAPKTGQVVSFSAAGASDPDGTIVRYRWDLDGDGVFETDTGAQPQATRSYSTPGTFAVTVRVQDNDGATATAGSSVGVAAAPVATFIQPPLSALKLTLKFPRKARLASLLKSGLTGSVNCRRSCTLRLTLRISSKVAKQMTTPAVIGKATIVIKSSGAKAVRIRLTRGARKQLKAARSFAITVTGTATDSARHSASGKATVQVKR